MYVCMHACMHACIYTEVVFIVCVVYNVSLQQYQFNVPEDNPLEVTIGQVQGDDNDIGSNAVLYYHLLGSSECAWL